MNSRHGLDATDITILRVLQESGRAKRNELAEMTGLSLPSVSERLKKLEEEGIVKEYRAVLDHEKLGFDVSAFITVTVDSSKYYSSFLENVNGSKEVIECHAVTGDGTHMLKVRVRGTRELESLLSVIQSWDGVKKTLTNVVLSSPKETTVVPVVL